MLTKPTMMSGYINESPRVTGSYLHAPLPEGAARVVAELKAGSRFVLTGCGTSYHLALLGARYFQTVCGADARALPSFDLAWYQSIAAKDTVLIAISHSGASKATLDAVAQARRYARFVVGVSASDETPLAKASDAHIALPGGWEKALPKTRIFTAGSFQLLQMAGLAAGQNPEGTLWPTDIEDVMSRTIAGCEVPVDDAAAAFKGYDIFHFAGGGPAWVVACEAALKMRENNYTACEGYEVEELSHGRTATFEADRPVVGIALRGPSVNRLNDMLATAHHIGAPTMVITEEGVGAFPHADYRIPIPAMPSELAAAIIAALPLQMFSHQFSLHRGIDPDTIRLDQPDRAFVENKWIFPPGTH